MRISIEKGASSWLSTLPIQEHGFALHKGAFRDTLCLRYGWQPKHLPSHCASGSKFTVDHALNCHSGGFPSIRHNDITVHLLTEVCHGVGNEPYLQPVTDERLFHRTANREDGARLDIVAEDFWGRGRQQTYFDVRVFNPLSRSYQNSSIAQSYRKNEQEKRRQYDERIREIEHGSFSPLIFTTSGSMGPTAIVVYKRIATMIAEKKQQTLQQNHPLDEMPYRLFSTEISNHEPTRKPIRLPPASIQHRQPGPRLQRRPGPHALLNI